MKNKNLENFIWKNKTSPLKNPRKSLSKEQGNKDSIQDWTIIMCSFFNRCGSARENRL